MKNRFIINFASGFLAFILLSGNSFALTTSDIINIEVDTFGVTHWGSKGYRTWIELPAAAGSTTWAYTTSPMVTSALTTLKSIGTNAEVNFIVVTATDANGKERIDSLLINRNTSAPTGVVPRIWMQALNNTGGLDFADLGTIVDVNDGLPKALVASTPGQASLAVTSLAKSKPVEFDKGGILLFNAFSNQLQTISSVASWINLPE